MDAMNVDNKTNEDQLRKKLIFAFVEYLQDVKGEATMSEDSKESLEVATQVCLLFHIGLQSLNLLFVFVHMW